MKKGAIGIVEELAEQGYSIKESLAVLAEAKQRVKNIRRFAEGQFEGILLKDASRQQEEFLEELLKESDAQFKATVKEYMESSHRLRFY